MIILLYGPPGAGKNTQGELLAKKLGMPFVSTGNELRAEAKRDTPLAKMMRPYLESGKMMPSSITGPFMLKHLMADAFQKSGYITDGFPRIADDAHLYLKNQSPSVAIFLSLPDQTLVDRLLKRGRADDTEAIIAQRQKRYKEDIGDIRPILEKAGVPTFAVDGRGDIQTVEKNIWETLKPLIG